MELVPSAVGPIPIEQRYGFAKVRMLRSRVESRGGEGPPSSSSGAWRFLRGPGPRVLLGPVRKDKKVMDLQDPKSASVSAQAARKVRIPSSASVSAQREEYSLSQNGKTPCRFPRKEELPKSRKLLSFVWFSISPQSDRNARYPEQCISARRGRG